MESGNELYASFERRLLCGFSIAPTFPPVNVGILASFAVITSCRCVNRFLKARANSTHLPLLAATWPRFAFKQSSLPLLGPHPHELHTSLSGVSKSVSQLAPPRYCNRSLRSLPHPLHHLSFTIWGAQLFVLVPFRFIRLCGLLCVSLHPGQVHVPSDSLRHNQSSVAIARLRMSALVVPSPKVSVPTSYHSRGRASVRATDGLTAWPYLPVRPLHVANATSARVLASKSRWFVAATLS